MMSSLSGWPQFLNAQSFCNYLHRDAKLWRDALGDVVGERLRRQPASRSNRQLARIGSRLERLRATGRAAQATKLVARVQGLECLWNVNPGRCPGYYLSGLQPFR